MINNKIGRQRNILLLIAIGLLSFNFTCVSAESAQDIVEIKIFPEKVINERFYGFGAETLPWLWTKENKEAGVNEEDIRLNLERIRDMRLAITRIFVPWETWNPSVDYKTFTWESDEMRSLYKMLDLYQEMETKVILVTVDWLENSPWNDVQGSARAVAVLFNYLIKERGYSCIQFWTLTNEPELTYGWLRKVPFKNYVEIHKLVKKWLKERELSVKIIVSDEVESLEWFNNSVQSLHQTADVFSSHFYLYPQQKDSIANLFQQRLDIINNSSSAKRNIPFFVCEFGFRGAEFGACINSLIDDYEYGLYVADLCIKALNSGVSAASLWCLHQIRLIDEINPEGGRIMRIGLWAYKDENWRPFPIFYLYRLFTRYITADSKVLKVTVTPADQLKAACVKSGNDYVLIIANMNNEEQSFLVQGIDLGVDFKKYLYSKPQFPSTLENLLKAEKQIKTNGYLTDTIPSQSVAFYTNEKI